MLYHCKQLDSWLVHLQKRNKIGNNRWNKKELLERIMGNFKSIMYSSLLMINKTKVKHQTTKQHVASIGCMCCAETVLCKYKDCEVVGEWIKSITNHMYWCAASLPQGDGDQMVVQWKSLMELLCDQHDSCYHPPLGERRKKWFIPGIKLYTYTYIYV